MYCFLLCFKLVVIILSSYVSDVIFKITSCQVALIKTESEESVYLVTPFESSPKEVIVTGSFGSVFSPVTVPYICSWVFQIAYEIEVATNTTINIINKYHVFIVFFFLIFIFLAISRPYKIIYFNFLIYIYIYYYPSLLRNTLLLFGYLNNIKLV